MTEHAAETRAFKVHPQLLWDVIQRQAGTLTKAVAEGVMNSIDAGAKTVRVSLSDTAVSITDDGKGFRDRKEIELFFETFGQPHEEGDATYGTFRMGRGQMFSFGKNRWRSGRFSMAVDIKGKGLDYDLTEESEARDGCEIKIELYRPLSLLQRREIADDLRRSLRYVPVELTHDGAGDTVPKWVKSALRDLPKVLETHSKRVKRNTLRAADRQARLAEANENLMTAVAARDSVESKS
jgi:hypothetical protein